MLAYATSQLRNIDEAQHGSVLQLTGLELVGRRRSSRPCENLKVTHLKPLKALCVKLSQSMSLALRFSHYISTTRYVDEYASENIVQTPELGGFLTRACGFQGSEFTGRLEVLDLVAAFNRPSKSWELTSLTPGETVEICDSAAAVSVSTFDPRDSEAVAVPGYGIGCTARSCLPPITEMEQSNPPASCVTSLYVAGLELYYPDIRRHDELGILRLFGPSLKVLRVSQKNWFQQRGLSQYLPQLETLEGCKILVQTCLADFVALPKLRALGLECCYLRVEECLRDLLIPCAGKLQELRASLHMSVDHIPRVEALLRQCLGRLVHIKLDIKTNPYNERVDKTVTMGDVSTIAGRSKLAFLGAIHDVQT